jgi:predicted ATPase
MPRRTRSPLPNRDPFLTGVYLVPERVPSFGEFPFSLPFVDGLDLDLDRALTFFVGENGSGKSTLLEAIAGLAGYHVGGGGKEDLLHEEHESRSILAGALRPRFRHRPRDGFFFRSETLVNFATLLERRRDDPDFWGDPYLRYGGSSLHARSHGEAFLNVFQHRIQHGLFLIDEPEAALSPQRQMALLALLHDRVESGEAQFIIATHSPILLTFPGAEIINFDDGKLAPIRLEDTNHYKITRGLLENPGRYWASLKGSEG